MNWGDGLGANLQENFRENNIISITEKDVKDDSDSISLSFDEDCLFRSVVEDNYLGWLLLDGLLEGCCK
jgi:hypothetical protein